MYPWGPIYTIPVIIEVLKRSFNNLDGVVPHAGVLCSTPSINSDCIVHKEGMNVYTGIRTYQTDNFLYLYGSMGLAQ